ncbi:hypothetical protein BT93_I1745 [Corymbia citriodora subsp. variegata]|nr:hypothetical protein BT93_I1745 [Corymbia citriodora subsp. variegata]
MSLPPPPEDPNEHNPRESGTDPNLSLESLDDLWSQILQETTTSNNEGPSASIFIDQQDPYLSQTDRYPSFPESDSLSSLPEISGGTLQKIAVPRECSTSSSSAAAIIEMDNEMNNELRLELAKSRELGGARGSISVMSCETEMEMEMTREKKKEDHNAKERVRRMNLNACYLTLANMLPHTTSTKKRRGAPAIIDGVLEYIPVMKKEIEELTLQKENMLSAIDQNKQSVIDDSSHTSSGSNEGRPTISVHEIARGELVLQICTKRDQRNHELSNLLQNLEAEGISILNASTVEVPHDRVCFHLHIQMNASSNGSDYIPVFEEKITFWLLRDS